MITGLLAEVTGKELIEQASKKAAYYHELQAKIQIEIDTEKRREKEGMISEGMGSKMSSIISDLESRLKVCKNKDKYFSFMKGHLREDEIYRLNESELSSFEFIPGRY